jgi:glycosyltransferase involved in cell wall biosynthesis
VCWGSLNGKRILAAAGLDSATVVTVALHIVPEFGVGGVELSAQAATKALPENLPVHFLSSRRAITTPGVSFGPRTYALDARNALHAVARARALDADVLIFSLWKSVLAFALLRLMHPRARFVTFLHSDRPVHVFDAATTWFMIACSDAVWADCAATLRARLRTPSARRKGRVISFVVTPTPRARARNIAPRFVFWGRLSPVKRIDRSLELVAQIARLAPGARFLVIGPDAGAREMLLDKARALGIGEIVAMPGPMSRDDIEQASADATFFLQLSDQEGAAMSLIEAMQLGLIPIVTPVGAMGDYCTNGENGVVFRSTEETTRRVIALLADHSCAAAMGQRARDRWADVRLHHEDKLAAALDLTRKSADARISSAAETIGMS